MGKYFPCKKRKVKVEELIKHLQGYISVEEYSLKCTLFSKYFPSFVSNPRDDISIFVIGVAKLVKE